MATVLRFEVERRSDVFAIDLGMVVDRLEWAASIEVHLINPQTGQSLEMGESAHGGDGELYRSPHVGGFIEYRRDDNPQGPHRERLFLAYDRQQDQLHAEAWSEGERILRHDRHIVFDTNTAIIEVVIPFHAEADAAVARVMLTDLTLHGLIPTNRPVEGPPVTERVQEAQRMWQIRQNPSSAFDGEDGLALVRRTFETALHMHPTDPELRQLSLDQLSELIDGNALDTAPYFVLLVADQLVAGGQYESAKAIYYRASLLNEPHTRVLAYAGLSDIADILGEDPEPYIREALDAAPSLAVGQAWIRRRRVGHLLPAE